MKTKLLGLIYLALLTGPAIAAADQVYDFTYTDGGVSATGTLDVSGGQAVSGTGTITSSTYLGGSESLTLVTLSTPGVSNLGGGNLSYRFGGGTDLIGDTIFNSSDPWVSTNGLVFLVGGPGDNGFNVWANGTSPGGSYTGFIAGDTNYESATGTFTATPVPLPAAAWLLLSGLAGMGLMGRRRPALPEGLPNLV
jgi:hypothetical protein